MDVGVILDAPRVVPLLEVTHERVKYLLNAWDVRWENMEFVMVVYCVVSFASTVFSLI